MSLLSADSNNTHFFSSRLGYVAVRIALLLFCTAIFWVCGNIIVYGATKNLRYLNREMYLDYKGIYQIIGIPIILACIAGLGYSVYDIMRFFIPFSSIWLYLVIMIFVGATGWALVKFYIDWIKWLS